ncbi:hypothetical protein BCR36DRAFT_331738 [Piromyces finnis]|uniref:DNA-directed RNA polymerase III subunit RPC9 n=1 Tax=Piromyces finnis TaxID=1754191 RepID=A0A1Y1V4P9_9FUNG|nr:hypothetical protein BCR36DRAFT_331738 [Piromyces finnis]|eukprot:ORX46383.1 hypothetical protein BCR36DRAFT_331738 [Piromyces finnis]
MEVVQDSSVLFLDYELYSFLQSKDIKKKGKFNKFQQGLSTIEYEVNKYLSNMPSSTQTPEQIGNIIEALKPYALTMTEVFQIINLRPKSLIDLTLIIEECESRFTEENLESLLIVVKEQLPRDDDDEEEEEEEEESGEEEGEGEEEAEEEEEEEDNNEEYDEMDLLVDESSYKKDAEDDIDGEAGDDD